MLSCFVMLPLHRTVCFLVSRLFPPKSISYVTTLLGTPFLLLLLLLFCFVIVVVVLFSFERQDPSSSNDSPLCHDPSPLNDIFFCHDRCASNDMFMSRTLCIRSDFLYHGACHIFLMSRPLSAKCYDLSIMPYFLCHDPTPRNGIFLSQPVTTMLLVTTLLRRMSSLCHYTSSPNNS